MFRYLQHRVSILVDNIGFCHLQKFSNGSVVVGCIRDNDTTENRKVVTGEGGDFADWCELNYLQLNISKRKELVVNMRRSRSPECSTSLWSPAPSLTLCCAGWQRGADANRFNKLIRKA